MQKREKENKQSNTNGQAAAVKRPKFNKDKFRKFMLGTKERQGFLKVFCIYALLICIGFIYLNPILHMISRSFMSLNDLLDSSVNWIPSAIDLSNYAQAAKSMDFWRSLGMSIIIAGVPTICNLISCAVIGYGLARFEFPGRNVVIGIILFTFILPTQITMISTYLLYTNMGIIGTLWAFVLPSLLGMGINAPIFILIFWQFFRQVPKVLIEAAQIDGAGYLKSFFKISLPSAAPAIITVSLFSFVWYWNESYLTELYVSGVKVKTGWTSLVIQLDNFATNYNSYAQTATGGATRLNESINMAGTMLSVLPLMLMYFILQRYFVESIDRTGITGE
ncbi:carbohydrate ABC transporter permease [bacterium 1xD8-6]|jgi:ABC-type sugar transport system, permease component|nr:carbohydrate ABC transporter permease [bacterium D16-36]RKI70381.1 carbohydrate ABC transporter permease [bacterium 1xD8-6]